MPADQHQNLYGEQRSYRDPLDPRALYAACCLLVFGLPRIVAGATQVPHLLLEYAGLVSAGLLV